MSFMRVVPKSPTGTRRRSFSYAIFSKRHQMRPKVIFTPGTCMSSDYVPTA
jgi:hypothetical protein